MVLRRAKLKDVARQAGVSISTASKAFNNKPEVATATKARVFEAAATLHFAPNALIRTLQCGSANTVGICTWPFSLESVNRSLAMHIMRGIYEASNAYRKDILLYSKLLGPATDSFLPTFMDGRVDGLIVSPHVLTGGELTQLAEGGLPTVVLYNGELPDTMGSVLIDNYSGVRRSILHLHALGHSRIAFHRPGDTFDLRQRTATYRQVMLELGLDCTPQMLIVDESFASDIERHWHQLQSLPFPPTALIVGHDSTAIEWLEMLTAKGVRVPEDFSIIGFDDVPDASSSLGLTTVRQDAVEVGRQAMHMLWWIMAGERPSACRRTLDVELIVRDTTAAPRASKLEGGSHARL